MAASKSLVVAVNVVRSRALLCKRITLAADGALQIAGAVQPSYGVIRTVLLNSMQDVANLLAGFTSNEALMCSNTIFQQPVEFTTKEALTDEKRATGTIARSQEYLKWAAAPTLFALDHDDKGGTKLTVTEFNDALVKVFPPFNEGAQLVTWSSSSCIYRKDTDQELRGPGSFHVYNVVKDGADVERFAVVLQQRLWLAGYGHIFIDKVGKMHVRSIIDGSIYGSQGIMFEAPPELADKLVQRRPAPIVRNGALMDTTKLADLTDEEVVRYAKIVVEAKRKAKGKASEVAREYEAVEVEKLISRGVDEAKALAAVKSRIKGTLSADDLLHFDHLQAPVSVATVLSNLHEFDGKSLADPREPDYLGQPGSINKGKAKLFANPDTRRPAIHSFAHGGSTYELSAATPGTGNQITRQDGVQDEVNDSWVDEMNQNFAVMDDSGTVFVMGGGSNRPAIYTPQGFNIKFQNRRVLVGVKENGTKIFETIDRAWLSHPRRREYSGFTFHVGPNPPSDKFNLWTGFSIQPKAGDWSKMRWHLQHVVCQNDPVRFAYATRFIAWILQNPGRPPQVAFVMLSQKEGTGKGTLMQWIGDIFGSAHYRHIDSVDHILGRFNEIILGACVAFLDEALFAGNPQHANRLKGLITEPMITMEGKNKPRIQIENRLAYFMASNENWAIPAGRTARRYFVTEVSDAKLDDTEYFLALNAERESGGPAAMFDDLRASDLGIWAPWHAVPKTEALYQQKRMSLTLLEQWVVDQVEDDAFYNCKPGNLSFDPQDKDTARATWKSGEIVLNRADTHEAYVRWFKDHRGGLAHRLDGRDGLGRALKDMLGAKDYRPREDGDLAPRTWLVPRIEQASINLEKYLQGKKSSVQETKELARTTLRSS